MRREYAVAVLVAHEGAVLLHFQQKIGRWLPPGGHVDTDELPDAAAVRETLEETGVQVVIVDAVTALYRDVPRPGGVPPRLPGPIGIQLEDIPGRPGNPAHQHVDFVYAARVAPGADASPRDVEGGGRPGWFGPSEWSDLGLTPEVASWAEAALRLCATDPQAPSGERL